MQGGGGLHADSELVKTEEQRWPQRGDVSAGIQIKQGLFYFITASAESVLDLLCGRGSVSSTHTVKDNQVKKNKYCCVIVLLEGSVFCFFSFFS